MNAHPQLPPTLAAEIRAYGYAVIRQGEVDYRLKELVTLRAEVTALTVERDALSASPHAVLLATQRQREALVAERDALRLQVAALVAERDAMLVELAR
jgi:hypothetical protein